MIKLENLTLRQFKNIEEVSIYVELRNDMNQRAETDHTELLSKETYINRYNSGEFWSKDSGLMLISNDDNLMLGTISFKRTSEFEINIGYGLLNQDMRGKGIMTQSLTRFCDYLFETIPFITRLSLYTAEDNLPSRKLAEKCGFEVEGVLRKAYFYRGKICNWVIYSKLRE